MRRKIADQIKTRRQVLQSLDILKRMDTPQRNVLRENARLLSYWEPILEAMWRAGTPITQDKLDRFNSLKSESILILNAQFNLGVSEGQRWAEIKEKAVAEYPGIFDKRTKEDKPGARTK